MRKLIPAITLITMLGLQTPMHAAWQSKKKMDAEQAAEVKAANTPGFNLQDNRSGFVEADYLFWLPVMENMDYAIKATSHTSSSPITVKGSIKQPSFDLSSGVRVGIGGYNHDRWDIGLRATYLYSDAVKHSHADPSQAQLVFSEWLGSIFGPNGSKASARWKLNFYLLDFTIGREFFLTKRFAVHPFIGLRGAGIYQNNRNNYLSNYVLANQTVVAAQEQFRARQKVLGIGPRIGFDLNFYLSKQWAFLGGLAGSLLYTHYNVKEKFDGSVVVSSSLVPTDVKIKNKANFGRGNLDAYFGLGWNYWFNKNKNRIGVAVTFEGQQWFNLNQFFQINAQNLGSSQSAINLQTDKNHGDLSLIGGTIHFQCDF